MKIFKYNNFSQIPYCGNIEEDVPIFATQQYADYLKETKNYNSVWLEAKEHDVHYLIPFSVMKKGPFKKGMFLTAVISLGNMNTIELEKKFLNEIVKYIKKNKLCDWIQQPPNWAIFNTYPDGSIYTPFGTYRINMINKTEEELFKNLYKKNRQYVNKAHRGGVVINKGIKYLDDALSLIRKTLSIAEMDFIKEEVVLILKERLHDKLWVYVAYYNDIPQSSTLFLSNSFSTYTYYAGKIDRPIKEANPMLHWEAIKDSKNKGTKYFDFVGARINPNKDSKQYRIQRFKSHFGTELIEGFLWKMVINSPKYRVFLFYTRMMVFLKGKAYKGDIIDQEIARMKSK